MLEKSRSVLYKRYLASKFVVFSDNGNDEGDKEVIFSKMDWEDMGSPFEVTVTIEPGDKLNAT